MDIERPHRFEFDLNEETNQVEMWYKNLRQQDFYWNKEPIIMFPKGFPTTLDGLEVATPLNDLVVKKHIIGLAKHRLKFMKVFELATLPTISHLLSSEIEEHWTRWWDRFSMITVEKVLNA